MCLGSHSLCCGIIPQIALRLLFCSLFLFFFLCVCSDRMYSVAGWDCFRLLRKANQCLCSGDETGRYLHTYELTGCCWRRGSERCVSKLKHCSNMSIFLLIWVDILNFWIVSVIWVVVCQDCHSFVFPVCMFICNCLPGASQMFIILSAFVTSSLCCAFFLG